MIVTAMRRVGVLLALGALGACGGGDSANADSSAATTDTSAMAAPTPSMPAGPTLADPQILSMIGMSNAAEIAAGEQARTKATNAQVKAFAGDMVTEHRAMQKMADSLTQANPALVAQAGPSADSAQAATKAIADSLQAAPKGADFDRMYMASQVAAHEKTLTDLNNFNTSAQDAGLKAMITGAIPKVQAHLDRARQIHGTLGAATP